MFWHDKIGRFIKKMSLNLLLFMPTIPANCTNQDLIMTVSLIADEWREG